jgi:hypothetical protein
MSSALSFDTGRTRSSNVLIRLATDGSGAIAVENNSTAPTDFILDIAGYFQ